VTASLTEAYLHAAASALRSVLDAELVGAYVHGSIVLGDFSPARSDIDVVAVCTKAPPKAKEQIGEQLSEAALPCPASGGLEFHLVDRATISPDDEAPLFELHLSTTQGGPDRIVDGAARSGDPDLVLHYAVLHDHGRCLGDGPLPGVVFARPARPILLRSLARDLRWALDHASPSYRVLNACRAWRFVEEGVLCSKTSGAEWALGRAEGLAPTIEAALRHRGGLTDNHPSPEVADPFVRGILAACRAG
jgi:predicted nucleotidyltransferase